MCMCESSFHVCEILVILNVCVCKANMVCVGDFSQGTKWHYESCAIMTRHPKYANFMCFYDDTKIDFMEHVKRLYK
jgi:hypothetical protein